MSGSRQFRSRLTYPNPFSPSGIDFELPDGAHVTLRILDALGREIALLIEGVFYSAGTHHVDFEPAFWSRASGDAQKMFYYRLSIEMDGRSYVDTKQIVVSRQ